jgi:hypothetical protein
MFILSATCPPLGMDVELELQIPAFELVPRPTKLCFVGQVNRIEVDCRISGFALAGQIKSDHSEDNEAEQSKTTIGTRKKRIQEQAPVSS